MLRVERDDTIFTSQYAKGEVINIPIAHHDGNYFADDETLRRLEGEDRIALRYCDEDGAIDDAANPNGSLRSNIAGVLNRERNGSSGLMPHPGARSPISH